LSKNCVNCIEDALDDVVHVVVFVFAEATAEDDILLFFAKCLILREESLIFGIIDGVIGLHAWLPFGGIFAGDDGLGLVVDGLAEVFEVLVLDDAGVGSVGVGVVHYGVALVVRGVEGLRFESYRTVLEGAVAEVEVLVYAAGVDYCVGEFVQAGFIFQIVYARADFYAFQHLANQGVIATDGDALVEVVEVVVVEDEPDGEAADDGCGEFGAGPAPLLAGVALDQLLVDVAAHQEECLLFQVAGLGDACICHGLDGFGFLLVYFGLGFLRGVDAPHLVEGVHVEGQIVELALVVGHRAVGVAVELYEGVDIVPDLLVGGVEDVRTVLVDIDALDVLAIDVAADMWPTVNYKAGLALGCGKVGKGGSVESSSNNQVVVFTHASEFANGFALRPAYRKPAGRRYEQ